MNIDTQGFLYIFWGDSKAPLILGALQDHDPVTSQDLRNLSAPSFKISR